MVRGRRSPYGLYDSRLASEANQEWFDNAWAAGFTASLALPFRVAARARAANPPLQVGPQPPR
jgi:hypothetical protein